jgi:hypothetical protein
MKTSATTTRARMEETTRAALSGSQFSEVFVDSAAAACSPSAAAALADSHSLLMVNALASPAECEKLRTLAAPAALREQADMQARPDLWTSERPRGQARKLGRVRLPVREAGLLSEEGRILCDQLLMRALCLLQAELPELIERLFGPCLASDARSATGVKQGVKQGSGMFVGLCSSAERQCAGGGGDEGGDCSGPLPLNFSRLAFAPLEPAVNIYWAGGAFKRHEDKQSLTLLVPLSDGYEGGGTGFWTRERTGASHEPAFVLRPSPGTALVWGGQVKHAGIPVISGERWVFVASFSPASDNPLASEGVVG